MDAGVTRQFVFSDAGNEAGTGRFATTSTKRIGRPMHANEFDGRPNKVGKKGQPNKQSKE
jgi:hypothetical protein